MGRIVKRCGFTLAALAAGYAVLAQLGLLHNGVAGAARHPARVSSADRLVAQGRNVFRNDTFGDQAVWGGVLGLHKAIEGAKLGGVGPGVSPKTALALGLKVDATKIPAKVAA